MNSSPRAESESAPRRRDSRRTKMALLSVGLGVLLVFVVVEVLARVFLPAPGFVPHPLHHVDGMLRDLGDDERLYGYTPDFAGEIETSEYHISLRTNSLGFRDDEIDSEPSPILALGDSFTVGYGVQAQESWPERLSRELGGLGVFNAGVSGYSVAQIRATFDQLTLTLDPEIAIIGLFSSRYWRVDDPYVVREGFLVSSSWLPRIEFLDEGFHVSSDKPLGRGLERVLDRTTHLGAHLFRAVPGRLRGRHFADESLEQSFSKVEAELAKLDELARERAVAVVVLGVTEQQSDGTFSASDRRLDDLARQACERLGIPFVSSIALLEPHATHDAALRIGGDHHWSVLAHDLVGRGLARELCSLVDSISSESLVPACLKPAEG